MFLDSFLNRRKFISGVAVLVSVAFLATVGLAGRAVAQSGEEAGKIAAELQPESQTRDRRLSGFAELPDGTWKMHGGDLAHGEAASLDDSGWETIAPEGKGAE